MSDETPTEQVPLLLLDKKRMAAAICVSEDTLDGMRKAGCPCIPFPGARRVLFDPQDVVAWLKAQAKPQEDTVSLAEARARADVDFGKRKGF